MSNWSNFAPLQAIELARQVDDDNATTLSPLHNKQCLSVEGIDAGKFLQGQLSCDINEIDVHQWQYGSHCNHKGRMLSSFRAAALSSDHFLLCLSQDISQSACAALAKYIVFSKATISEHSNHMGLGLSGPEARSLLVQHLSAPVPGQSVLIEGGLVIAISQNRFELWLENQQAEKVWEILKPFCTLVDSSHWTLLDIKEGIGEIRNGSQDLFIPQMLNLNELGGISYTKGCYTGQEIVARMEYRGKLKRHMVKLQSNSNSSGTAPKPGAEVFCQESKQSVGNIVVAQDSPLGLQALAVCSEKHLDQALFCHEDEQHFEASSLSYAITTAKELN